MLLLGVALGLVELWILQPDPLISSLRWQELAVPVLILLVSTGFTEELVFRGVIQRVSLESGLRYGILYVSILFALLHVGYGSLTDVAFVFAVGLLFGYLVARTGSLLGVSLAHGLTNVGLYLVVPLLVAPVAEEAPQVSATATSTPWAVPLATATPLSAFTPGLGLGVTATMTASPRVVASPTPWSATPRPRATPTASPVAMAIHIVAPGETLSTIAARYGTTVERLVAINELAGGGVVVGQVLVVPSR